MKTTVIRVCSAIAVIFLFIYILCRGKVSILPEEYPEKGEKIYIFKTVFEKKVEPETEGPGTELDMSTSEGDSSMLYVEPETEIFKTEFEKKVEPETKGPGTELDMSTSEGDSSMFYVEPETEGPGTELDMSTSEGDSSIFYEDLNLNIVYPEVMRKRNIEACFDVHVKVNSKGNYELSFPDNVQKAFENAVRNAFKGKKSKVVNAEFIMPIEFVLK